MLGFNIDFFLLGDGVAAFIISRIAFFIEDGYRHGFFGRDGFFDGLIEVKVTAADGNTGDEGVRPAVVGQGDHGFIR